MSDTITVMNSQEYTGIIQMLLQANGGRLRPLVTVGNYTGSGAKFVEQIGPRNAQRKMARNADTPIGSTPHDARWIYPEDWEVPADLIDKQDLLRLSADPTNSYIQGQLKSAQRGLDEIVLKNFFATAKTGITGTTDTAFDTTNHVVSIDVGGTASGMNLSKLIAIQEKFATLNVDTEAEVPVMVLTPKAHSQLLAEAKATSLDYNTNRPLVTGRLPGYLGIEFIVMNLADSVAYPTASSLFGTASARYLPCWVPSGMQLGMWDEIKGYVGERADKSYATQIYTTYTAGATRVEEGKVLRVSINETA